MGKRGKKTYISLLILITQFTFCAKKGLVIVPVADLAGQPLGSAQSYRQLPWAARGSDYAACPRLHQLLFNETVEILEIRGNEVKIRIPNLFYQTQSSDTPQTDYWTLRRNIRPLETLKQDDLVTIPAPISFREKQQPVSQPIVTLVIPYQDKKTGKPFSAGSRFVCAKRSTRKAKVAVYRFNEKKNRNEIIRIPGSKLYRAHGRTKAQQRADFVQILQRWAHTPATIPYVWGGYSFTNSHKSNRFSAVSTAKGGYYQRVGSETTTPKTGFDCAGLIARAAQIVGLPYYLKNSYTIAKNLLPLPEGKHLRAGDIIWIPGHVMLISDIKKGLIVEAHAYGSGYGRVHELHMSRIFKGIETCNDLETAFRKQTPLQRLNSNGNVFATYPTFKLLRISLDATYG